MKKTIASFPSPTGGPLVGASVTIVDHYSGAAPALYEDDETTAKANPLTTDANGSISFKVRNGVYDFQSDEAATALSAVPISGGGEIYLLTNESGGAIAYGKVCRFSTVAGEVLLATDDDTEAAALATLVCITDGGVADGEAGAFQSGPAEIRNLTGGTAGSPAFLAGSGAITTTVTTTPGEFSVPVGKWVTTTNLHFAPQDPTEVA